MRTTHRRALLLGASFSLLPMLAAGLVGCRKKTEPVPPAPQVVAPANAAAPSNAEAKASAPADGASANASSASAPVAHAPAAPAPAEEKTKEDLSAATIEAPREIDAGRTFRLSWTGPNNPDDYITLVTPDTPENRYARYVKTQQGREFDFLAPVEPGDYEIRYVAAKSKKVLGRSPIKVLPVSATLNAPATAMLGTTIEVEWTGPNNPRDYITVVAKDTPDGRYDKYTETAKGSPLKLTLPVTPGDAELRYMTGEGAKVLARRDLKILEPKVTLEASDEVTAGTVFKVSWTGPDNPKDYVTIVPAGTPDGQYRNYTETGKGSSLALTALVTDGEAELRYMTGSGARVLARRPIKVVPAKISLEAPAEAIAGAMVVVEWTGPANRGDYLTIVRKETPDGQYARYSDTSKGSPAKIEAPMDPGAAEVRYVSGQGSKVLARRPLTVSAAKVTLNAPTKGVADKAVAIEWTGPDNVGDYLTIVPKSAKDGAYGHSAYTNRGSPASIRLPKDAGPAEVRYVSGQGARVLARADIEVTAE